MKELTIGVVLPVFNGAAFLLEALDSIAAQTLRPCDIVAVDDGSIDRSVEILQRYGVRVLTTERAGQASARDRGISAVGGDVIACLDQDDRWLPDKLDRQMAALAEDPAIDFIGCLTRVFLHPGADRPAWWKAAWDGGAPEPSLAPSATLYRRDAFERAGDFASAGTRLSEDFAWTARAQDLGLRSALVDEILVEKRVHAHNTSSDQDLRIREHLDIVRQSIARKRGARG